MPGNRRRLRRPIAPDQRERVADLLRNTRWSEADIARSAGLAPATVTSINLRENIRDAATRGQIGIGSVLEKRLQWEIDHPRKKTNFFSAPEKEQHIQNNLGGIHQQLRIGWRNPRIRAKFVTYEDFLEQAMAYVREKLDYYDPREKGQRGRGQSPSSFVIEGAKIFSLNEASEARRQQRRQLNANRLAPEKTPSSTYLKLSLPPRTKRLLGRLGVSPVQLAEIGVQTARREVLRIAEDPQTGLSAGQKNIVHARLENQSLTQIGRKRGITPEAVRQSEIWIIKKMKAALEKRWKQKKE